MAYSRPVAQYDDPESRQLTGWLTGKGNMMPSDNEYGAPAGAVAALPQGFAPHFRNSPLTDPWEPLYSRVMDDRIVIGLWLRPEHTNSRGMAHGGLIAALADNAMGMSCSAVMQREGRQMEAKPVTVSLAIDYVGAAKLGQWVAFDTQYVKTGKTLCFAQAFVTADGEIIARADAKFRVM